MAMDKGELTAAQLLSVSGEFDLESIHLLNVEDSKIEDISVVSVCTNLTRLNARRNEISILFPLRNLKLLTWLNLSANRVTNIDPLSGLDNLMDLNLAGNLIGSFDRVKCLQNISKLEKLRFCDTVEKLSNPICHNLSYEKNIMQMFPNLLVLDGTVHRKFVIKFTRKHIYIKLFLAGLRIKGKGSELFRICSELDEQIKSEK